MLSKIFGFFGGAWTTLKSTVEGKFRLYIEYILIAIVVSLAGFAFATWIEGKSLEHTIGDLNTRVGGLSQNLNQAIQANQDQDSAIDQLKQLRQRDSEAINGLNVQLSTNAAKNQEIRSKISQLERNNAEAKLLLDTAVPSSIGCVLDGTCPAANRNVNKS